MKLPTIPPGLAGKIVKYRPLSEPIRLQDLQDSSRSQAWKKKNYWMRFFLISEIISSNPQPSAPLITLTVACVESVSARVRRESWDESKKKRNDVGRGGERRKRLPANPTILKNCVRPRTQLLISAVLVVLIT